MRFSPIPREKLPPGCDPVSCLAQKHLVEIETLLSIQQAISSQLNLNDVLQMIVDETLNLTSASISFVYILEGDKLRLAAVSGYDHPEQVIGSCIPVEQSLAGFTGIRRSAQTFWKYRLLFHNSTFIRG